MALTPRVTPFGERALLVELSEEFDEAAIGRARAIADAWERLHVGVAVPAYASVVLGFAADQLTPDEAEERAREILAAVPSAPGGDGARATSEVIEIPTRYDGADLADVAARSGVSVDELVSLHSGRTYTAYFLGFLPGFAYCGRLDPRIVAPRLERPRERVPAGAVAVADGQTGVYPFTSPGGWRLIGSTHLAMFDPAAAQPSRLRAGDRVRFAPR
ncbi:MAG TPA: 5-oxoprolinase subunit PxpB [Methylomirabilota bacterium]|nr:5-oxoprolinase subunit PxpB [Methylomirabilota bacterium]